MNLKLDKYFYNIQLKLNNFLKLKKIDINLYISI